MKRESCIIISNLSEEDAIKVLPKLKGEILLKKATLELENPGPPEPEEVCEKEYERVNNMAYDLDEFLGQIDDYGDSTTAKEVRRDVAHLRKQIVKMENLFVKWRSAVDALEEAANRLEKK